MGTFKAANDNTDHSATSYLPSSVHQAYESARSPTQHIDTVEYTNRIPNDSDLGNAGAYIPYNYSRTESRCGPRMDSTSSTESSTAQSIFSTLSTMSVENGSVTSYNSSTAEPTYYHSSSTSFFEDYTRRFEEPDCIEPLALPERHSRQLNHEGFTTRHIDAMGVSFDNYSASDDCLSEEPGAA